MSIAESIATDLVISPFAADAADMVEVARCAEESGFDGVWTLDHFSGAMLGHPWSREAFTTLGAIAVATDRVRVGPLVANMVNRDVALLASAASTLQSLSGGRAVLGLGVGAAPGSRFAAEQEAVGRAPGAGPTRRRQLAETISAVRLLWGGGGDFAGEFIELNGLFGVVGPEPEVPVVVGASGRLTLGVACEHADGLNLRVTSETADLVVLARSLTEGRRFEISVHDFIDHSHRLGGEVDRWISLGVDRRTLAVSAPFDLAGIAALGSRLHRQG